MSDLWFLCQTSGFYVRPLVFISDL